MHHLSFFSFIGILFLSTTVAFGQTPNYPIWLHSSGNEFSEYPTDISSVPDYTAVAGISEYDYFLYDLNQNDYYVVPCLFCLGSGQEEIFVKWRQEGNPILTWTANVALESGNVNNRADVQSTPQVDISVNGSVYLSFSFRGYALIQDAQGNQVPVNSIGNTYDIVVVKFDQSGNYIWHIEEGSEANDFVTDVDYNDATGRLAIAGYAEGPGMPFDVASSTIPSLSLVGSLGPNLPFGNAFAAAYEDVGSSFSDLWATSMNAHTYSTDIVVTDNALVYLSGFVWDVVELKPFEPSYKYIDDEQYNQYFMASFDDSGTPIWGEVYGTVYDELLIAPELRHSSMAYNLAEDQLFFAFNNTGSASSSFFPFFGTYVNQMDPSDGSLITPFLVGTPINANTSVYPNSEMGSPTYNPNIAVDEASDLYITGNFLLASEGFSSTNNNGGDIGMVFHEIEIGNNSQSYSTMFASGAGHPQAVGIYTANIDLSAGSVQTSFLNQTYTPIQSNVVYNQLEAQGTSQDVPHVGFFFSAFSFYHGRIALELTVNQGQINYYDNDVVGGPQWDGMLVRTVASNGLYGKPNDDNDTAQDHLRSLGDNSWTLAPNPVRAHQTLFWKSDAPTEQLEHIRLIDLTGRVLQTWTQPQSTRQGFQLRLGELVPGTYLLEATGENIQQSTMVVVH